MEKSVLFTLQFLDGLLTRLLAGAANLSRCDFAAEADPRNAMIFRCREDVGGGDRRRHQRATTSGNEKEGFHNIMCVISRGHIANEGGERRTRTPHEPPTPRTIASHEQDLHLIVDTSALLQSPKLDRRQSSEKQRKEPPGRGKLLFPQYMTGTFSSRQKYRFFFVFTSTTQHAQREQDARERHRTHQIRDRKKQSPQGVT